MSLRHLIARFLRHRPSTRPPAEQRHEVTVRCTRCRGEFSDVEIESANACPACGSRSVPMLIANDVQVTINWHELRILVIWAERWAALGDEQSRPAEPSLPVVYGIADRLQLQHPDQSTLTLRGELSELDAEFGPLRQNIFPEDNCQS